MTTITLDHDGPVATVTLNRPEVHNAFNEVLIAELTSAFVALSTDDAVRVIVLRGDGKSFCAGADLEWMGRMVGYSHNENFADARTLQTLLTTIDHCPKVTVAAVHGGAFGGGVGLMAACDLVLCAPETRFALTEVRLGILPAIIAPFVRRRIGPGALRTLAVTASVLDVDAALRIGLIDVAVDNLHDALKTHVEALRRVGPNAVAATKRLLRALEDGVDPAETVEAIAAARVSDEGQEGIRAFLEKRKPRWTIDF